MDSDSKDSSPAGRRAADHEVENASGGHRTCDGVHQHGIDNGVHQHDHERLDIRCTADGNIDLSAGGVDLSEGGNAADPGGSIRPWIGIHFECCNVYSRLYRAPDALRYEGHCPRCGLPVSIRVARDGVNTRLLRAKLV